MTDTPQPLEAEDEISLLDLLQTIVDNLRLLIIGPLVVGLAALGISFAVPPTYTATVKFLPPQQQQSAAASMLASLGGLGGLAGAAAGLKSPADQYMAFLKSNSVQDELIERFKLQERYKTQFKDDTRKELTENTRASSGKEGIITVQIDDIDPKFAADLANAHVDELQKLLAKLAVTEAQQRRLFFEKQLTQAKDKLTQAEIELKATGVSGSVLKSNPIAAVSVVAALQAQATAQEVKVGAMRGYLAETAPDFKQALTELANLRAQLAKQEKDGPSAKATGEGDYVTKYREFKYHETLFELFAKQYELAKVDEAREGAVIQVLDVAQSPEKKAKPKRTLVVIGTCLVVVSILLLFIFIRQGLCNASENSKTADKLIKLKASWSRVFGRG